MLAKSTAFEELCSLPWRGRVQQCVSCFSTLMEYRLGLLPSRSWDPERRLQPPRGWLKQTDLRQQESYARITFSVTVGSEGSFAARNWDSRLSARSSAFSESQRAIPPVWQRGGDAVRTVITRLVIFHTDCFSGPRRSGAQVNWSFLHMFRGFVTIYKGGCSFTGVFDRQ